MDLEKQSVTVLRGISVKRAALYKKLGIESVWDLLTYYPRGYVDLSAATGIGGAELGEVAAVKAVVRRKLAPRFGKLSIYRAELTDGTDSMTAVFFNTEYSFNRLVEGQEYIFYGKLGGTCLQKEINAPTFIRSDEPDKILPLYRLTAGLSRVMVANNLKLALELYGAESADQPDPLSAEIRERFGLCDKKSALEQIHFPRSAELRDAAKKRLAFEELLTLGLGYSMLKNRNRNVTDIRMDREKAGVITLFYDRLPFSPTGAQRRAVSDCLDDMCREVPMNRLLQGDVGSGKTLVAAAACLFAKRSGYQSAVMVPTEILAKQHYETFRGFLEPLGGRVELLVGSLTAKEKNAVKARVSAGETDVAIGTQALIQGDVDFAALGLVVTDEQHRFGVKQRGRLAEKGGNPHILVMSATPIPRTLALLIYGDLDLSVLNELPKGRQPTRTYAVDGSYRDRLYAFIKKYIAEGRQAYIVCPLVGEGENETVNEKAGAVKYFERMKTVFPEISVGLLHGKMKNAEKDEVMGRFKSNEISLLISTTVIEVGVDVPNAVVMMIENAEQFGLSQLHQLRGRVGRGEIQSHCALVTDSGSAYTRARMDTMVRTCDGFESANEDLKLRGPGDFFGKKQHGLPELKTANLCGEGADAALAEQARLLADEIIRDDGELNKPENAGLKRLTDGMFSESEGYGIS